MIGAYITPYLKPIYKMGAKLAYQSKLKPTHIAFIALGTAVFTFLMLAQGIYSLGLLGLLVNRYLNAVHHILEAVYEKKNPDSLPYNKAYAVFLERVFDHIFYIGSMFFMTLSQTGMVLPGTFMILAYSIHTITGSTYMLVKQKNSAPLVRRTIFGLAEGAETVIVLLLMCAFPPLFPILAVMFGFACLASTVGRVLEMRLLSQRNQ